MHRRPEDRARRGEAPQRVIEIRFGGRGELGARLAAEVLNDDLPNMPELAGHAGLYAGGRQETARDLQLRTRPQIVEAFKGGWVQLTADQQPFMQGYLPVLSLCQEVVYGLAPIDVDTVAGFLTLTTTRRSPSSQPVGLR